MNPQHELIGYTDRFSIAPGEVIRFMINTTSDLYDAEIVRLIHGDENPLGPGFKSLVVDATVNKSYPGRKQRTYCGSYGVVADNKSLSLSRCFTLQAWIYATTPARHEPQGLISKWSRQDELAAGYGLFLNEKGELELWLADKSGAVDRWSTGAPIDSHAWYFVAATCDLDRHEIRLYQIPHTKWPGDPSCVVKRYVTRQSTIAVHDGPLLFAAGDRLAAEATTTVGLNLYNGKLDNPCILSEALSDQSIESLRKGVTPLRVADNSVVAVWNFAADPASDVIADVGPNGLHGKLVNMPMRAVTGHRWSGNEQNFRYAPDEYSAIHFHDDDLEDACWEADFEWTVPIDLPSGIYAARLTAAKLEDFIPFVIRQSTGPAEADVLLLIPSLTYLAYANFRVEITPEHGSGIRDRTPELDALDVYLSRHPEYGKSIYDRHSDGSGCCYSSRLRPNINLRPKYRFWLVDAPRHFAADLYLVDWLEEKKFNYAVVTDEDLHHQGPALLSKYRVVLTGSHPEYYTTPMRDAIEEYTKSGGRLMYLGGNGFYWVTSIDPRRPHLIEVRRGFAGSRDWSSRPGECHHSTTGELGGHWRFRGKSPNQLVGVGFTAMGWDGQAPGYYRQPASFDPRANFIFEGIGAEEIIGNFGLVLGGAAGDEIDRLDYELGTPRHVLLLASSVGHSSLVLPVIEDFTQLNAGLMYGQRSENVRADMVYFETPGGGAVFSTGSINWIGSLSHKSYDNNVSRITENVLRRFASKTIPSSHTQHRLDENE